MSQLASSLRLGSLWKALLHLYYNLNCVCWVYSIYIVYESKILSLSLSETAQNHNKNLNF